MTKSKDRVPVITLTTDFGLRDGFVGVLKGVIWSICPEARIADLSHTISPQNVIEGAYVLRRAARFFPPGTIHIGVVDPGVGTARRPLAMRLGTDYYVGPDNGLFSPLIDAAGEAGSGIEIVHLTNSKFWLPGVSRTFHGRDIFAPVGAHLANGVRLADLGPAVKDPVRLELPKPERTSTGWRAHIVTVDVFGNLATDLPAGEVLGRGGVVFRVGGREVRGLVDSYGLRPAGELVALVNSEEALEIAVVNGSAVRVLGVSVGDPVEVVFPI